MNIDSRLLDDVIAAEEKAEIDDVDDTGGASGVEAQESTGAGTPGLSEEEACGPVADGPPMPPVNEAVVETIRISELAGAPLFFVRGGDSQQTSFPAAPAFAAKLERTAKVVAGRAPDRFGRLESIASAGIFVDRPPSLHAKARACDWDVVTFADVRISPFHRDHEDPSAAKRARYWSLAALIRSCSAFVLHAEFNAAHEDHIHQDDGGRFAFDRNSGTTVKLVQALCNEVFGTTPALVVDGSFGQLSQDALRAAMDTVHVDGDIADAGTWRRFLRRSGRLGFEKSL
jgi:hypothetical protein